VLGSSKVKSHSKRLRNSFIGFVIRLRRYAADGIQNQNKPIRGRIFLTKDLPKSPFGESHGLLLHHQASGGLNQPVGWRGSHAFGFVAVNRYGLTGCETFFLIVFLPPNACALGGSI